MKTIEKFQVLLVLTLGIILFVVTNNYSIRFILALVHFIALWAAAIFLYRMGANINVSIFTVLMSPYVFFYPVVAGIAKGVVIENLDFPVVYNVCLCLHVFMYVLAAIHIKILHSRHLQRRFKNILCVFCARKSNCSER